MIPISCIYFPGGKQKAVTLSYDDGRRQDQRLVEILNQHGLKGTFHLNSGLTANERIPLEECASVYQGHEISAHSVTHPALTTLPKEQIAWQILEDRRRLEAVTGYTVRGMSYPYGRFSPTVISQLAHYGIEYARTTRSHGKFMLPENFLEWHPTVHHRENLLEKTEEFLAIPERPWDPPMLMYVWGHSFEFDRNLPENNWGIIEAFAARVAAESERIWFATNIEIVDYMNASKQLRVSVDGHIVENHSHLTLWISVQEEPRRLAPGERLVIAQ